MRTRTLLSALAAVGLWGGLTAAQTKQPPPTAPPRPGADPPSTVAPTNSPPRPPVAEPPGQTTPPPKPVAPGTGGTTVGGGTTGSGTATGGSTGGSTVVTPAAVPPELAKLEAQAATEIPVPPVPAGKAPEAKKVAEAAVRVHRATWVVEKLLPAAPEGVTALNFTSLAVGNRGWIDTTGEVVKTAEGVMVVRPSLASADVVVGLPATDTAATTKTVSLRGEYVVDRTVSLDGRDVLVLKEVNAAKPLDPALAKLIAAARVRLEQAKADYANAVAVLTAAKKKAVDAVMERANVEAAKQVPVPDNATGEQRIKAKRDQDELAGKLAQKELDAIAEAYGVVPAADPTRK
jgi:hypothetical protein